MSAWYDGAVVALLLYLQQEPEGVGTLIVSDSCALWCATALLLRRSLAPVDATRRSMTWSLLSSALHKSIAAALDPSFDVVDEAFPVASAIDIWARDPPAVSTLPARSA